MNKKVRWITETAVLLALLVVLQSVTKPMGQIVTGSCVNAVLAIAALMVGMSSGVTIAIISPVLAFLLGIAGQSVTIPAIMAGNAVFVILLSAIAGKNHAVGAQVTGWLLAAVAKFVTLYILVAKIICGIASAPLLASGTLKPPMLEKLPATFTWPQLITALIGGGIAVLIARVLRKALKR